MKNHLKLLLIPLAAIISSCATNERIMMDKTVPSAICEVGDTLEILSPSDNFQKTFKVEEMFAGDEKISVADKVQQIVKLKVPFTLSPNDILRRKK